MRLALPSADSAVRDFRRGGREHLGRRFRSQRADHRRHEFRRRLRAAHGPGRILRQRLRQARPTVEPARLRLFRAHALREPGANQPGRARHVRRDRLPGRRAWAGNRESIRHVRPLHRAIYWHKLIPDRSTFKSDFGGTLLSSDDPEFRPVDLALAPDGAIMIADWCDVRANHVLPEDIGINERADLSLGFDGDQQRIDFAESTDATVSR